MRNENGVQGIIRRTKSFFHFAFCPTEATMYRLRFRFEWGEEYQYIPWNSYRTYALQYIFVQRDKLSLTPNLYVFIIIYSKKDDSSFSTFCLFTRLLLKREEAIAFHFHHSDKIWSDISRENHVLQLKNNEIGDGCGGMWNCEHIMTFNYIKWILKSQTKDTHQPGF